MGAGGLCTVSTAGWRFEEDIDGLSLFVVDEVGLPPAAHLPFAYGQLREYACSWPEGVQGVRQGQQ